MTRVPRDKANFATFEGDRQEITLRDASTGKLRTVQAACETVVHGDWYQRPKRELWERDDRRKCMHRVLIECDRRLGPRAGEQDPEVLDPHFLAALWQLYYR